jgi:hypothetical protein
LKERLLAPEIQLKETRQWLDSVCHLIAEFHEPGMVQDLEDLTPNAPIETNGSGYCIQVRDGQDANLLMEAISRRTKEVFGKPEL